MKLIFLDIDGVINSTRSFTALTHLEDEAIAQGQRTFEHIVATTIDPVGVALVNKLAKVSEAKVVISSSHRGYFRTPMDEFGDYEYDLPGLRTYLATFGLDIDIIGATPRLKGGHRGEEIEAWLREFHEPVERYVILDDDADMLESQLSVFVNTSHVNGMLHEHYLSACKILDADPLHRPGYRRTHA